LRYGIVQFSLPVAKPFVMVERRRGVRSGNPYAALTESPVSVEGVFDAFWAAEHAPVLALAAALTGDWGIAEDVTQEAFSAAHQKWDRIDNPAAWVRGVVANRAASHWRRRAREASAFARFTARPDVVLLASEHNDFWEKVRSLPRRQAQYITLHYLDERSVSQIADALGIAEGTVKATLSQARASLGRLLSAEEAEQ
jgi:RNA polymerase sigma-70 factor (ECF subfamily)